MLIGDLSDEGPSTPWIQTLRRRIDVAAESGVDTMIIVFRTSSVEYTFRELDSLIRQAGEKGLSVIPRIVVNSGAFTKLIKAGPPQRELLPDYTDQEQLEYGVDLLKKVIRHLEEFPNVVAYQVEWGHWGESWINAPFWDSPSSIGSFLDFLHGLSPAFSDLTPENFSQWAKSHWVTGDAMFYSPYLPEGDPRRNPLNVAVFYWYQEWRNETTRKITWTFRSAAKEVTQKPIIGFSYTGTGTNCYLYSAHKFTDVAYSDMAPSVQYTPYKKFIRDAYFPGLHLGELDFDTPYYSRENFEYAVSTMYSRGIVPTIFYPHWSKNLADSDIPILVELMKEHKVKLKTFKRAEVLLVLGSNDIGMVSFDDPVSLSHANAFLISMDPPGLIATLVKNGIEFDVCDAEVYSPQLGNRYQVVIVSAPRDSIDFDLQNKIGNTSSNVIIVHPSFLIGTPTFTDPITTRTGYVGSWIPIKVGDRTFEAQVWGAPPGHSGQTIRFQGPLSNLGTMIGYLPNHIYSYLRGPVDEVYASVLEGDGFYAIARVGNTIFFGLDLHVKDKINRGITQSAFMAILRECLGTSVASCR